jgi:Flp pilus assembly protein TadD
VLDYKISDSHLLALFYGNRAMRSLVDGRIAEAALWQREALKLAPNDATLLNNAGVVQQRLLDSKSAEALYLSAVEINPKLNSAMANLVALYRQRGDIRKSNEWQQRSSGVLRKDPYYQFAQGRRNELAGDINGAIDYYKRAITLNKREHVFHFYLARAYFETGSMRNADSELSLARQLSDGADQQRYLSKQEALRRLIAKKE